MELHTFRGDCSHTNFCGGNLEIEMPEDHSVPANAGVTPLVDLVDPIKLDWGPAALI
jgi:hypothetical protein